MNPMTVGELMEELEKLPTHAIVVTASDDEGNSFNVVWNTPTIVRYKDIAHKLHNFGDVEYFKNKKVIVCVN